jgi:uncharacterized protein (TIGR02246 family)
MSLTTTRALARQPEQVHELFAAFASAGDADGLMSLFEPEALMIPQPGMEARGSDQLQAACAGLCSLGAHFEARTDAVHVAGDLALMTNTWTATTPSGESFGGRTTEVVRRQPDGRWLAVIDYPNWIA